MRVVAAIPLAGLLVGCVIGLYQPNLPIAHGLVFLASAAIAAIWSSVAHRQRLLTAAVVVGFASGGALLAGHAWRQAWRPTLRVAFESMARDERRAHRGSITNVEHRAMRILRPQFRHQRIDPLGPPACDHRLPAVPHEQPRGGCTKSGGSTSYEHSFRQVGIPFETVSRRVALSKSPRGNNPG